MTAANLAHLPLQVGGVVLASAGRGALWLIARYMKAPLTHTAIAALVGSTALAGSNALFMQAHEHPAPMFAPAGYSPVDPSVKPVVPLTRPASFGQPKAKPVVELKAPATPAPALTEAGPIGNKEVVELQRKLEMLQFYSGKIDGLYGRRTAEAIRKFETATGRSPRGELNRDVLNAIIAAPLTLSETPRQAPATVTTPTPAPAVEEQPRAAVTPQVESPQQQSPNVTAPAVMPASTPAANPERVDPATLAQRTPLATPTPLQVETGSIRSAPTAAKPTLLGRPLPTSPDEALDMAADTAGDAIDSIINNVQNLTGGGQANSYVVKTPTVTVKSPAATAASTARTPLAALPQPAQTPPVESRPPESQPMAAPESAAPAVAAAPMPAKLEPAATPARQETAVLATPVETPAAAADLPPSSTDPALVSRVQRGLASLGFLHGPADGIAGEATAKAIRNFEIYFNFEVTGRVTPGLLDLLIDHGASI